MTKADKAECAAFERLVSEGMAVEARWPARGVFCYTLCSVLRVNRRSFRVATLAEYVHTTSLRWRIGTILNLPRIGSKNWSARHGAFDPDRLAKMAEECARDRLEGRRR